MGMASADEQTDADFFDKLVDDDDPANDHLTPDDGRPSIPESAGSPASASGGKGTVVKQATWASFGGDDDGPDPFADLAAAAEDAFLGNTAGAAADDAFLGGMPALDTSSAGAGAGGSTSSAGAGGSTSSAGAGGSTSSAGAADHAALPTTQEVTDQDFFGAGTPSHNDGQLECSGGGGGGDLDHLQTMYPGWKYDHTTQQWYQVEDASSSHLHQNSAAALHTIAEETNWPSQGYPPNMLFYAEYPGWYFDTNTQQWLSLESYQQQASIQHGAATALQNGYAHHQDQGQADVFANNSMQPQTVTDGSFYGFDQQANVAESISSSSTTHQVIEDHYNKGSELSSSVQRSAYNSTDSQQQSTYNTVEPSAAFQTGYNKGFQPATVVSEQSTSNQGGGFKPFQPSLGSQTNYKPFQPSTAGYKGFMPSTGSQAGGYKGSETSATHQASYNGFDSSSVQQPGYNGFMPSTGSQAGGFKGSEASTAHQAPYNGFEPSSVQQPGYMTAQPSSGQLSSYTGFETSANHGYANANGVANAQGFVSNESMYHGQKQANAYQQGHLSNSSYLGTENSMNFAQQQFLGANASHMQFGHSSHEGRSSAGRPPHALVSFAFGGKLIVMKENSSMVASSFNSGNQETSSATVSVLNLSEVVDKADLTSNANSGVLSYFHALCRQPVPGPLVGGSAASKDVNKWLDEMIAWYESSASDFQRADTRKLLISLLKILCQHYGKLRSPYGSDPQEESNGPEMAVTKLFSSCKKSSLHMGDYGSIVHCMKNIPPESQIQAVAQEVQNLLVSGRRMEALQCAQGGQLWGPAIILALQLGDQFYVDTVKKMAQSHFVSGSPLRTLCLLIAGQPADVFSVENNINGDHASLGPSHQSLEPGPNDMLEDWEENLAIIVANRTKGDDLVITHLGDCLWKDKYEVAAAHSCYLVAELNIDSYSESARLCLIGADHLKCPRTFVSPEAIQRTEVYEYAKVLGNSQYILLPFQPYKFIYACMLAEVGRISDSLRYCQASMKVLKASGRAPELETWKQLFSSLEERIRTHQQGGYGTNLAPTKLVGKIFTSLDKSISRMMGTPSAPLPPLPQGSVSDRESNSAPGAAKFGNSQSLMAMSSLMPSVSMQSMSEIADNSNGGTGRKIAHNRSVSEPDFGRTPKQGAGSDETQSNASGSGSSRLGWLGSTLQKTMGLVSKSHRQAKLGNQNKFYYDEKLKRWVEEGASIPAEEPPLPPPPTKPSFQNSLPDHKLNGPMSGSHAPNGVTEWKSSNSSEHGLGMPPIPPSQNQFSARGRMGVRSRYVDTFNKGGASGAMPSYNKPAAPSVAPPAGAKFFMPTAAAVSADQMPHQAAEIQSEISRQDERSASPPAETSFSSPLPSTQFSAPTSSTIYRHPSMDNISTPYQGSGVSSGSNSSSFSKSRAASWSGTYSEQFSATAGARSPDVQAMPLPLMPGNGRPSHSRSNSNSSVQFNGVTEDLHEVEL